MKCKKLMAVVVSVMFSASNVFALSVPSTETMQAGVNLSGTGVETWNVVLKNISGAGTPTTITWDGVTAGMDQYKVAEQYIEVSVNITNPINWRMLMYTNNTSYTGDKSKGSYGLVGTDTSKGLPLAWRVQDSSHTVTPVEDPVFSTTRPEPDPEGFADYMWKFVVDKTQTGTDGWDATDAYVRVWDNDGFYWNEGVGDDMDLVKDGDQPCPAQSLDDLVYVYLGAGFHQSLAQVYSTTSLTLEILVL